MSHKNPGVRADKVKLKILATSEDFEIFRCLTNFTFISHNCEFTKMARLFICILIFRTVKNNEHYMYMLEHVSEMCEVERDKCSGCQFELERQIGSSAKSRRVGFCRELDFQYSSLVPIPDSDT